MPRRHGLLASFVIALSVSLLAPSAGAADVQWVHEFGTNTPDVARSVAVGSSAIYVAGITRHALPSATWYGAYDGFVRKYSLTGRLLWTDQFGTPGQDGAADVATDGYNIYVVGWTGGSGPLPDLANSVNRDPGRAILRSYKPDGTLEWSRTFGPSDGTAALSVAATPYGPFVTGMTRGTFAGQHSSGGEDVFVATFSGGSRSVTQFGTAGDDVGEGISYALGGYWVSGNTDGTLGSRSFGQVDAFVRKYHFSGTELWTRQFGTPGNDYAPAVAVGRSGVYVAGESTLGVRGTDASAFVRNLSLGGSLVWNQTFGTPEGTSVNDLTLGTIYQPSLDAVYVTGATLGALPGQTSAGGEDAFVRTIALDGSTTHDVQFGTSENDNALGIEGGSTFGAIGVAGMTGGVFPGETFHGGGTDAFVSRMPLSS